MLQRLRQDLRGVLFRAMGMTDKQKMKETSFNIHFINLNLNKFLLILTNSVWVIFRLGVKSII
jgi:hypothetical protein